MRENRPYGSEGGKAKSLPYPYQGPRIGGLWIASSQGLLAMMKGASPTRSIR